MEKLRITRTQDEIVDRIAAIENDDVLGFGRGALLPFLDYEHARANLKDGVTEAEWDEARDQDLHDVVCDYLRFAWEKANGFRGISAYRSLAKLKEWSWLSGDESLMAINFDRYSAYGKEQLRRVTARVGMDPDKFDDGVRLNQ